VRVRREDVDAAPEANTDVGERPPDEVAGWLRGAGVELP
jgi:hypothetical protein